MFTSLLLFSTLQGADAAEKESIFVFTSDQDPSTIALVDSYKAGTTFAIRRTYDLGSVADPQAFIEDNLADAHPALIFALGDVALAAASRAWPNVPLVYGNVGAASARRSGRTDMISVSGHVDPALAAADFSAMFPYARTVSVVRRTNDSDPWWPLLESELQRAGVDVRVVEATGSEEVADAVGASLFDADVLWIAEDPDLWTPTNLRSTFTQAEENHVPIVTWEPHHLDGAASAAVALRADSQSIAESAIRVSERIVVGGVKPDALATYPAPLLVASREALLDARVPLPKRVTSAVDEWQGEESK